ncbi:hypothetical protein M758_8G010500 [Ceratodon purpureus]|uniref:Uncharacterized protein n=1 Tax=Ceratodon purpureus TaxID=3225 RepID=A0A8T0GVY9_CERPU|nr:hypothetical protein KC19_8G011200 [Ceratodon purpureus]KAG0607221.1 hypothetical protein M758_8G010500 [Ceratodon purpureus]
MLQFRSVGTSAWWTNQHSRSGCEQSMEKLLNPFRARMQTFTNIANRIFGFHD